MESTSLTGLSVIGFEDDTIRKRVLAIDVVSSVCGVAVNEKDGRRRGRSRRSHSFALLRGVEYGCLSMEVQELNACQVSQALL